MSFDQNRPFLTRYFFSSRPHINFRNIQSCNRQNCGPRTCVWRLKFKCGCICSSILYMHVVIWWLGTSLPMFWWSKGSQTKYAYHYFRKYFKNHRSIYIRIRRYRSCVFIYEIWKLQFFSQEYYTSWSILLTLLKWLSWVFKMFQIMFGGSETEFRCLSSKKPYERKNF